ncbi:PTS sugar transporter subunit IIB [Dongshaea marina]|uniref:PTS sugar transporter subunit IIB n=1 Tax=Dongshaea marina TaxID=2047966 RepID=UPI000D3E6534|nr:PTS sugar transporter subunit IIB [Dongshaea marina]
MKKILLVCDMGMSTSLVVKKMQEAALLRGLDIDIQAKGMQEFKEQIQHFDCALLGPQISYKLAECQGIAAGFDKRVECINMMHYGLTDGEKILDHALTLVA